MNALAHLAVAGMVALSTAPAHASLETIKKARCHACHAVEGKRVGPALRDIAARYAGQADAPGKLFEKVRTGGAGAWGEIAMAPHPEDRIGDAELTATIAWILDGAKD